jgi:hypothetical protein
MNGYLCKDCGQDHQTSLEALRCEERVAEACGCGHCRACRMAAWWRRQPRYHPEGDADELSRD